MNESTKKRIADINNDIIPEGYKKIKVGIVPVEWEAKQMKNICEINRGGSPRPIEDFLTDEENGINWIKIGDTSIDSKYITHTKEKIKPEGLKKTRQVFEGDFLLSNSMSYGRPYILKTSGCIHDGWLVISNYSAFFNLDFFYYLLCHNNIQRQYDTLSAGSGVQNLNKDLVAQVNICIPPLPEQRRLVAFLDEAFTTIATLTTNAHNRLAEAQKLKNAYLQKAFESPEHILTLRDPRP
jgi:type I restriction enzyme S subunit